MVKLLTLFLTEMMNERILKLVNETDSWCDKNLPSDWLDYVDEFLPQWNEKFAELIVRECADVITETHWHLPPTQEQVALSIKEHFGVEE